MAERYKRVFALPNNEYIDSSPVIIVAGVLLLDDVTGKVLAQLKFKSLSPKTIKGLRVNVYPFDALNRPLGEPVVHDYLDLCITRDSEFGQKEGIELPDTTTRAFTIEVTEVAFSDNSTWSSSGKDWQTIKEPATLIYYFKDAELVKQYQIKFGNGAKVFPCQVCDLWICTCGSHNHENEDKCHSCGMRLNYLLSLDEKSLASDKELRVKKEEYDRKKEAKKKAKRKTILTISISILLVVAVALSWLFLVFLPSQPYKSADALMFEGDYYNAALAFYKIKDYKDSWDRCFEAWGKISPRNTISASFSHTVGITSGGWLVGAGDEEDNNGELSFESWNNVAAIATAVSTTVGVKNDGIVLVTPYRGNAAYDIHQEKAAEWTDIVNVFANESLILLQRADGALIGVGIDGGEPINKVMSSAWQGMKTYALGDYHLLGLRNNGTVFASGNNDYGQCDVSEWKDITAIAAGFGHSVGLKSDGTVVATGYNEYGECNVSKWKDVVAIAAGHCQTFGIKADGTVYATGDNVQGQCNVSKWRDIVAVSTNTYHTVGLKNDGTVVVTGWNSFGQCDVTDWEYIKLPST